MNTLGSHIRNIRKSKNLTIKQLSEISDISIPFLSDIERDVVNPSVKSLQAIAKGFDITLSELVDFNDELDNRLLRENERLRAMLHSIYQMLSAQSL